MMPKASFLHAGPKFSEVNYSMAVTRVQVMEFVAEEDFISTLAEDFLARSLHLLGNLFMEPFGAAKAQFPVSEKGTMLQIVIIDMQITLLDRLLLHRTMPYMSEDWAYCSRFPLVFTTMTTPSNERILLRPSLTAMSANATIAPCSCRIAGLRIPVPHNVRII